MFLTVGDIEQILFNNVYSVLGVDVTNLEKYPPSMLISKVDIQQALLFYYTIRPYQSTISINQMLQPTKDVNIQEFKPSLDDEWYCMGV